MFLCNFIEKKISNVAEFLRTIGIKKIPWVYQRCINKHGHTTCHSPSLQASTVKAVLNKSDGTHRAVFSWHTVIYKIIILDNEVTTVLKSTTMSSKAHTETSQPATSCRRDQACKARQPHVPYNLNSQEFHITELATKPGWHRRICDIRP